MKWKVIPGFSKYEVSEFGDVRRAVNDKKRRKSQVKPGQLIAMRPSAFGYPRCSIRDDAGKWWTKAKHQVIALGFCGPKPSAKHHALHWDDNPQHNHRSNIRWGTCKNNAEDKVRNGNQQRGEKSPVAKLTEEQVLQIRARYIRYTHGPNSLKGLGKELRLVVLRRNWKHI